jgi:hypothetical protein
MMPVPEILAAAPGGALRVVEIDDFRGDMFSAVATSPRHQEAAATARMDPHASARTGR